ncbi:MAG: hypothetical protein UT01_C0029G0004 [Candidatus Daviesbacteria bacterium GW2011_GWA1_38_7]|nr:MAG: hypothetical protein UT01_C0029G0004 [Candidatus Daviesbacteria bacterium GW2011_GWA1_38_7]
MVSLFFITVVFYDKVSTSQSSISLVELVGLVTGGLLVFVYLYIFSKQLNNLTSHFTSNATKQLKRLVRLNKNKERIDLSNILSLMIFKNQQKLTIPILTALSLTFFIQFYIGLSFIFGILVGVIFGSVLVSLLLEYNQNIVSESKIEVKNRLNYLPSNVIHSVLELMILLSLIFSRVYR